MANYQDNMELLVSLILDTDKLNSDIENLKTPKIKAEVEIDGNEATRQFHSATERIRNEKIEVDLDIDKSLTKMRNIEYPFSKQTAQVKEYTEALGTAIKSTVRFDEKNRAIDSKDERVWNERPILTYKNAIEELNRQLEQQYKLNESAFGSTDMAAKFRQQQDALQSLRKELENLTNAEGYSKDKELELTHKIKNAREELALFKKEVAEAGKENRATQSMQNMQKVLDNLKKSADKTKISLKEVFDEQGKLSGFSMRRQTPSGVEETRANILASGDLKMSTTLTDNTAQLKAMGEEVKRLVTNFGELKTKADTALQGLDTSKLKEFGMEGEVAKFNARLDELRHKLSMVDVNSASASNTIKELNNDYKNTERELQVLTKTFADFETEQYNQAMTARKKFQEVQNLLGDKGRFIPQGTHDTLNKLTQELLQGGLSADEFIRKLRELNIVLEDTKIQSKEAELNENVFSKSITRFKDFAPLSISLSLAYSALNLVKRGLRESAMAVKEMDTAMVELRKVTNESDQTYRAFMKTAVDVGRAVGRSGKEVIEATADFARMGYDMRTASALAKEALVMLNVGDGLNNLDDATSAMVSTLKAFKVPAKDVVSEARKINDAFNEVANNFSINTADLASGTKRTAAVMNAAGNDMYETVGILTSANEIIQNIEKTSSGVNVIMQRINRIKMDAKTGELAPNLAKTFELANVPLTKFVDGIEQVRSTYDILIDLAKAFPNLDPLERGFISEKVSGVRQSVVFNALISNIETMESAMETAQNSVGSAMLENEVYLDSIDGKIQKIKSSLAGFIANPTLIEFVKEVLDQTDRGLYDIGKLFSFIFENERFQHTGLVELNQELERTGDIISVLENSITALERFDKITDKNRQSILSHYNVLAELGEGMAGIIYDENLGYAEKNELLRNTVEYKRLELEYERETLYLKNKDKVDKYTEKANNLREGLSETIQLQKEQREIMDSLLELHGENLFVDLDLNKQVDDALLNARAAYQETKMNHDGLGESAKKTGEKIKEMNSRILELGGQEVVITEYAEYYDDIGDAAKEAAESVYDLMNAARMGDLDAIHKLMALFNGGQLDAGEVTEFQMALQGISGSLPVEEVEDLIEMYPKFKEFFSTDPLKDFNEELNDIGSEIKGVTGILDEYHTNGYISADAVATMVEKYPEYLKYIKEENGQFVLTAGIVDELNKKKAEQLQRTRDALETAYLQANAINEEAEATRELSMALENNLEYHRQEQVKRGETNRLVGESVEKNKELFSSIDELNGKYQDGELAVDEYATSLRDLYSSVDRSMLPEDIDKLLDSTVYDNLSNALTDLTNNFNNGKISIAEYSSGMASINGVLLELYGNLNGLSMIDGVWKNASGDVDGFANSVEGAIGKLSSMTGVMDTITKNADVFKDALSFGDAAFTKEMISTEPVKQFQKEWQESMTNLKKENLGVWEEITSNIANKLGWTTEQTSGAIDDVNSDLYTSNENFNTAVNSSVNVLSKALSSVFDGIATMIGNLIDSLNELKFSATLSASIVQDKTFEILGKKFNAPTIELSLTPTASGKPSNRSKGSSGFSLDKGNSDPFTLFPKPQSLAIKTSDILNFGNIQYDARTQGQKIADSMKNGFSENMKNFNLESILPRTTFTSQPSGGGRYTGGDENTTLKADPSKASGGRGGGGGGGGKNELADRYAKVNALLEENNNLLKENDEMLKLHEDDYDMQIPILQQRNNIEKERQGILHQLNEERRKERQELERTLNKRGYIFEGVGDERRIANIDAVKVSTKEAEQELMKYLQLSGEISATSREWWALEKNISGTVNVMQSLNAIFDQSESFISKNNAMIERYNGNLEKQMPYIRSNNNLLMNQQRILAEINEERRRELQSMEQVLDYYGFKFEGSGDGRHITNIELAGAATEHAVETLEKWISKQAELADGISQWNDMEKSIRGVVNALEAANMQLDIHVSMLEHQMNVSSMELDEADYELQRAREEFMKGDSENYSKYGAAMDKYVEAQYKDIANIKSMQHATKEGYRANRVEIDKTIRQMEQLGAVIQNGAVMNVQQMQTSANAGAFNKLLQMYETAIQQDRQYQIELQKSNFELTKRGHQLEKIQNQARQDAIDKVIELEQKMIEMADGERHRVEDLNKQLQEYRDNLSALSALEDKIAAIIRKRGELEKKALSERHSEELEMAKERHEKIVDGYKEETDAFKKMIQDKLDALNKQNDEEDFYEKLRKEEEKLQELKEKIAEKSLDTSITGRNQLKALLEEQTKQEEDIAKMQRDRERSQQKDNLNAQLKEKEQNTKDKQTIEDKYYKDFVDNIKKRQDAEKKALDEQYENHRIYTEARIAINNGYVLSFDGTMQDLTIAYMMFEERFGRGMGVLRDKIEYEFIEQLRKAQMGLSQMEEVGVQSMLRQNYEVDKLADSFKNLTEEMKRALLIQAQFYDSMDKIPQYDVQDPYAAANNPMQMSAQDWDLYMSNKLKYETAVRTGMYNNADLNRLSESNAALRSKYGITSDNYSYDQLRQQEGQMGINRENALGLRDSELRHYMENKWRYEYSDVYGGASQAEKWQWSQENQDIRNRTNQPLDNLSFDQIVSKLNTAMYGGSGGSYSPINTGNLSSNLSRYSDDPHLNAQVMDAIRQLGGNPYPSGSSGGGSYSPITTGYNSLTNPTSAYNTSYERYNPITSNTSYRTEFQSGGSTPSGGGNSTERQGQLDALVGAMKAQAGMPYSQKGDLRTTSHRDCSSSVWKAALDAGLIPEGTMAFSTASASKVLQQNNFYDMGKLDFSKLEYGDVLLRPKSSSNANDGHIEMYVGDGKTFGAMGNGDTVRERYTPWTGYSTVLRLKNYDDGGKVTHTGISMLHGSHNAPEWIFNHEQFQELAKLVATYEPKVSQLRQGNFKGVEANYEMRFDNLINIEGNATPDTIPQLRTVSKDILSEIGRQMQKKGINPTK